MAKSQTGDIGVVLMAEPGRYEWSAILLVSSLLAFAYDRIGIHAYCRKALIGDLHPRTLAFFERHGVRLAAIEPGFAVPYPQGNKLYACAAERPEPATLLMDTDMMLVRPTVLGEAFRPGYVSGRHTSDWMWGRSVADWEVAYRSVGLEPPRQRMARSGGSWVTPSLAAAFVAYDAPGFGEMWRDTALRIEEKRLARGIYPTLDQISLPVATYRAGLLPRLIGAEWNKGGELKEKQLDSVRVHHYQKAERLMVSASRWIADALLRDFAGFDDVEALIRFYERQGRRPPEVHGNEGHWDAVVRAQLKVDVRHRPGGPSHVEGEEEPPQGGAG